MLEDSIFIELTLGVNWNFNSYLFALADDEKIDMLEDA